MHCLAVPVHFLLNLSLHLHWLRHKTPHVHAVWWGVTRDVTWDVIRTVTGTVNRMVTGLNGTQDWTHLGDDVLLSGISIITVTAFNF